MKPNTQMGMGTGALSGWEGAPLSWPEIVEAGGGVYRFLWGDLVMFDSPETGSTLGLPFAKCTPEAVRQHIRESNAKFQKEEVAA
jgi:hypothetical protein